MPSVEQIGDGGNIGGGKIGGPANAGQMPRLYQLKRLSRTLTGGSADHFAN